MSNLETNLDNAANNYVNKCSFFPASQTGVSREESGPVTNAAVTGQCAKSNGSTSSYKFLSWREKDRRRRFRDEWRHMWLVVPYGSYEVQCLVCHKVMTQRKLDTIKRHTVRRHAEVLEMEAGERVVLFEQLLTQHNTSKFPLGKSKSLTNECSNLINTNLNTPVGSVAPPVNSTTAVSLVGTASSQYVTDADKTLSSSVSSQSSSNSQSPINSQMNKTNNQMVFEYNFDQSKPTTKRMSKTTRKNLKINSTLAGDHLLKTSNKKQSIKTEPRDKIYSNSHSIDHFISPNAFETGINGSCLSPNKALLKCPWCLYDYSSVDCEPTHAFSQLVTHIQLTHNHLITSDLNNISPLMPHLHSPHPFHPNNGINLSSLISSPPPPPPPPPQPSQFTHPVNPQPIYSNQNNSLMSLIYYQEMLRQKNSESSIFKQPSSVPITCASNCTNLTMLPLLTMPSSHHRYFPPVSVQSSTATLSSFKQPHPTHSTSSPHHLNNLPVATTTPYLINPVATMHNSKNTMKFSTESLLLNDYSTTNSAFHNPTKSAKIIDPKLKLSIEIDVDDNVVDVENEKRSSHSSDSFDVSKFDIKSEPQSNNSKMETINSSNDDGEKPGPNLSPISAGYGNMICHTLRFGPNQDLVACLKDYVKRHEISAAFVLSCCGSVKEAEIRMADSGVSNSELEVKHYCKHFEIVSLEGSIYRDGSHLHISLSDKTGSVCGGHVVGNLIIHTTAEILLGQISGVQMIRRLDSTTGYNELAFTET